MLWAEQPEKHDSISSRGRDYVTSTTYTYPAGKSTMKNWIIKNDEI
jgi:hypothetical protein